MAKINTYPNDTSISADDKVVGTDAGDDNATKNYTIGDIANFVRGTGVVSSVSGTSPIQASPSQGDVTVSLATSGVTPNTYQYANISVDQYGRVTAAYDGTPVTSLNGVDGALNLIAGGNISIFSDGLGNITISTPGAISSLNGLSGILNILGGTNITVTDDGANNITISATGGVETLNGLGGVLNILGGTNVTVTDDGANNITISSTGGVETLNGLGGALNLVAGFGTDIVDDGASNITISSPVENVKLLVPAATIATMGPSIGPTLVATPGPGKAIQVVAASYSVRYSAPTYTAVGDFNIGTGGSAQAFFPGSNLGTGASIFRSFELINPVILSEDVSLDFRLAGGVTSPGGSDILLDVTYRVVDA
jgi:hypothetical protein